MAGDAPPHKQLSKKRRTTKRRRFSGNQHNINQVEEQQQQQQQQQQPQQHNDVTSTPVTTSSTSASASKIDLSFYEEHNEKSVDGKTSSNVDMTCLYMFADINIITELFNLVGRCPECNTEVNFVVDFSKKKGQAQKVLITCAAAECTWTHSTYLSQTVDVGDHNRFDVNLRSIIAFREIGRGLNHIERFNRVMNMCPPYSHSNYDDMVKDVSTGYADALNESLDGAACNVKRCVVKPHQDDTSANDDDEDTVVEEEVVENVDGVVDCDVSLDGAWQRRGYESLIGFVSVIERCSDKVVDVEVMTKDCRSCKMWNDKKDDPGYTNWKLTHECQINHEGSSTSMESKGAVQIFNRSIEKHKLRYVNYIGDGDSSAFSKVTESDPYPGMRINKLECIGHIQKRVGAGLIKLTQDNPSIKGRGEGKLTKKVINTLQNYYGMAIRSSKGTNVMQMKVAIAAVLNHCVRKLDDDGKEDKADRHKYCPKNNDTWCKYQKSIMDGTNFKRDRINIAEDIYHKIRPVWMRLSESALLEKCLHGLTQNVNEAFNAFVWHRCPKVIFWVNVFLISLLLLQLLTLTMEHQAF